MNALDRNKPEYKCQFATYLNMASNNFLNLTSHMANRFFTDDVKNSCWEKAQEKQSESDRQGEYQKNLKEKVLDILDSSDDELRRCQTLDYLKSNFPFLEDLVVDMYNLDKKKDIKQIEGKYKETMDYCFEVLNNNRNMSVHGVFKPSRAQAELIKATKLISPLRNAFNGARRIIADRFSLNERELDFLTGKKRYNKKTDGKSRKAKFVEREDFFYSFAKKDNDGNKVLSDIGLIFFTCLFLEKKYVRLFLDNTLFKVSPKKEQKIIYEIFACYRMHQVRERLDCEKDDIALGLDMLNEIHKCPKPLYELINDDKKKLFRMPSSSSKIDDALMVRSHDRFPYLAMKYIDSKEIFKSLRFQVALGSYRYKFYDKQCIDGTKRLRILQKDLNGFGRLQEIEERRCKDWDAMIRKFEDVRTDNKDSKPYITDCHAHYIYNSNRAGLSLSGDYMPDINGVAAPCRQPDCWLSTFELPAIIFLLELGGNPENIIVNHIKNKRRLYQDIVDRKILPGTTEEYILKEYNLPERYLPIKIRQYLLGTKADIKEKLAAHTKNMVDDLHEKTMLQLDRLEKSLNSKDEQKRGKRGGHEIKVGEIAQILAKDIISLQPSRNQGHDKLTGLNYSAMQSALALYDYARLKRIFQSAGLLNEKPYGHPFLKKVMKKECDDLLHFYHCYLEEKKIDIERRMRNYAGADYTFLHKNSVKWAARDDQYYIDLASRYLWQPKEENQEEKLPMPVELPRGLFAEAIKTELRKLNNAQLNEAISKELCNVNYLITTYFKAIYDDKPQAFYSYDTNGRLLELKEKLRKAKGEDIAKYEKKIADHEHSLINVEKELRQYKVEDMLLLLMAKKIVGIDNPNFTQIKLSPIASPKSNILDIPVHFSIKVHVAEGIFEIYQNDIKIKDYGKFLNFLYDKRIKTLLGKLSVRSIQRETLIEELDNFDITSPKVFQCSLEFEESEVQGLDEATIKRTYGNKSPRFSAIMEKSSVPAELQDQLIKLRNAFSHCFYPENVDLYTNTSIPQISICLGDWFKENIKK